MSNPDLQHTEKDLEDMRQDEARSIWDKPQSDCRLVEEMMKAVDADEQSIIEWIKQGKTCNTCNIPFDKPSDATIYRVAPSNSSASQGLVAVVVHKTNECQLQFLSRLVRMCRGGAFGRTIGPRYV